MWVSRGWQLRIWIRFWKSCGNPPSLVGFRRVGVMRQYERGLDGTFHNGMLMDMLAGELRE